MAKRTWDMFVGNDTMTATTPLPSLPYKRAARNLKRAWSAVDDDDDTADEHVAKARRTDNEYEYTRASSPSSSSPAPPFSTEARIAAATTAAYRKTNTMIGCALQASRIHRMLLTAWVC